MPTVTRRTDLEDALYAEIFAAFEGYLPPCIVPGEQQTRGNEVHLSDLLQPRQAIWKRMLPLPPTRKDVNLWMTGRGFEFEVSRRTSLRAGVSRVIDGISMRPDFMEWPGHWDGPIEMKWRRANLAEQGKETEDYDSYLDQLAGYCALLTFDQVTHKTHDRGLLIVGTPRQGQKYHDDLAPTEPVIHVYEVVFTSDELAKSVQVLRQRRDAFTAALERRDASQADLCASYLCGKRRKEVIKKPWCVTCQREFDTEYGIDKHSKAKTGRGHEIQHEVVVWHFEPRCQWYTFCAPQKTDHTRGGTEHVAVEVVAQAVEAAPPAEGLVVQPGQGTVQGDTGA